MNIKKTVRLFEKQTQSEVLFAFYAGDKATQEMKRNRDIDVVFITDCFDGNVKINNLDIYAHKLIDSLNQKMLFTNPCDIFLLNNNVI